MLTHILLALFALCALLSPILLTMMVWRASSLPREVTKGTSAPTRIPISPGGQNDFWTFLLGGDHKRVGDRWLSRLLWGYRGVTIAGLAALVASWFV